MATRSKLPSADILFGPAPVKAALLTGTPTVDPSPPYPPGPKRGDLPKGPPDQQAPSKLRTTHIRLGADADAYLDRLDAAWKAAGYRGHISAAAVIRHALARLDQDAKDDAVVRAAKGSS